MKTVSETTERTTKLKKKTGVSVYTIPVLRDFNACVANKLGMFVQLLLKIACGYL